jgi:hypothetical protein
VPVLQYECYKSLLGFCVYEDGSIVKFGIQVQIEKEHVFCKELGIYFPEIIAEAIMNYKLIFV